MPLNNFSLTISWLVATLPYAMSNINALLSYPSDLYFKAYSENAAQVDYLSCSFRSVYWGLSLTLCHAYLMGWHPYHISVVQNMWFLFQAESVLRRSNLETEVSLWKHFKCFPSTQYRINFENTTITSHFGFVFELNPGGKISCMISVASSFSKSFVFKMFSVHTKTQNGRFQIPPLWRALSKSTVFLTD